MITPGPIPPPIESPDLSVAAKLVLNKLLGYYGRRGKVVTIHAQGMTSKTASRAYHDAVRFLQDHREPGNGAQMAWEAWRDNEVKFKF